MPTGDHERRITDLESRVDAVESDAQNALTLSAAVDRDNSSLAVEMHGVKRMLAAHVQQTEERFAEVRVGMSTIIGKLDWLIDRDASGA